MEKKTIPFSPLDGASERTRRPCWSKKNRFYIRDRCETHLIFCSCCRMIHHWHKTCPIICPFLAAFNPLFPNKHKLHVLVPYFIQRSTDDAKNKRQSEACFVYSLVQNLVFCSLFCSPWVWGLKLNQATAETNSPTPFFFFLLMRFTLITLRPLITSCYYYFNLTSSKQNSITL